MPAASPPRPSRTRSTTSLTTTGSTRRSPPRSEWDAELDVVDGDVASTMLPAVRVASTIVRGAPEDVYGGGFQALHDWLETFGPVDVTQLREVYLDCNGPRDTWVTELQAVVDPT